MDPRRAYGGHAFGHVRAYDCFTTNERLWLCTCLLIVVRNNSPITLLVFRAKASANRSADSQRPAKRARRDGEMAATTRLFFFAVSSSSSSSDWQLQSLGVVAVEGDPSALQIHVMDGPSVVAFNTATSTLSLLQPRITDDGEYVFTAPLTNVALPSAVKAELLSCQFVGEEVTSTPHLLFQYAEVQEQLQEDDVASYVHLYCCRCLPSYTDVFYSGVHPASTNGSGRRFHCSREKPPTQSFCRVRICRPGLFLKIFPRVSRSKSRAARSWLRHRHRVHRPSQLHLVVCRRLNFARRSCRSSAWPPARSV
jgi:hypothetical protein